MSEDKIEIKGKKQSMFIDKVREILPQGGNLNTCIACGACAWVCPTGCIGFVEEDGMRKLVRWGRELPMAKDADGRPVYERRRIMPVKFIPFRDAKGRSYAAAAERGSG